MRNRILPENFDSDDFLRHYWQKKPLLIRAGSQPFIDPLQPDELAGLACEEFIESRLVIHDPVSSKWKLRNGPFTERDFANLPATHWSLLVQAVDQWHEGVKAMLADFAFIPSWRIDDIMISFASDGGGVGPHFDYYDVFLIQGLGRKRWRLGGHADSTSALLPDTDLRLLQHFNTEEEWIVEPGDILYLPPNIAHHGTAIGDSITYSIGFRTPSIAEIIDDLGSSVMQELREDQRYVDTAPQTSRRPGEITAETSARILELLQAHLLDIDRVTRWFGGYMTRPKYADLVTAPDQPVGPDELPEKLADQSVTLIRNPSSRFAFTDYRSDHAPHIELFVDDNRIDCAPQLLPLVSALCTAHGPEPDWRLHLTNDAESAKLLARLYNQGSLLLDDGSDA